MTAALHADRETAAVVLRSAADRIAERGLWRGEGQQPEGLQRQCAVTAIIDAAAAAAPGKQERRAIKEAAFAALAAHLALGDGDPVAQIIDWNDHTEHPDPQRMVVDALNAAADKLLTQAGGAS